MKGYVILTYVVIAIVVLCIMTNYVLTSYKTVVVLKSQEGQICPLSGEKVNMSLEGRIRESINQGLRLERFDARTNFSRMYISNRDCYSERVTRYFWGGIFS